MTELVASISVIAAGVTALTLIPPAYLRPA